MYSYDYDNSSVISPVIDLLRSKNESIDKTKTFEIGDRWDL